jgi:DNA-binding IclR family transcriptional regulator
MVGRHDEDDMAFILSSRTRMEILRLLVSGPTTPSVLADESGFARPHVSRTLGELCEIDAARRSGVAGRVRIYTITSRGIELFRRAEELANRA